MNRQRSILTATFVLIGLAGEISDSRPATAASHYPLWVCGDRYGGWGWSRPAGPFAGPAPFYGYEYWYPAYSYDPSVYVYAYPCPYVIYAHECGYGTVARRGGEDCSSKPAFKLHRRVM
jgi:hypothetical protein